MLGKFERHMAEIQANVKVLTKERDKTNLLYEQVMDVFEFCNRIKLKREEKIFYFFLKVPVSLNAWQGFGLLHFCAAKSRLPEERR